jgi:hypothetical protein
MAFQLARSAVPGARKKLWYAAITPGSVTTIGTAPKIIPVSTARTGISIVWNNLPLEPRFPPVSMAFG